MFFYVYFGKSDSERTKLHLFSNTFDIASYHHGADILLKEFAATAYVSSELEHMLKDFLHERDDVVEFLPGLIRSGLKTWDGTRMKFVCNIKMQEFMRVYLRRKPLERETMRVNFDEDLESDSERLLVVVL